MWAEYNHGIFLSFRFLSDTDRWKIVVELTFDGTIYPSEIGQTLVPIPITTTHCKINSIGY